MRFVVFCSILCLALWCGYSLGKLSYDPATFLSRDLEQTVLRPEGCTTKRYSALPSASIIITAQDEKPKTLEALVKSILHKTTPELLESIIIVDDASTSFPVPDSMSHYPGVRIIHNAKPLGVAASRMAGAAEAEGTVLVFLDSHMEVTERWLEPLLEYIKHDPLSVVIPVTDAIEETGEYSSSLDVSLVTFNPETWNLQWTSTVPAKSAALETPIFLGSAFAISKKWWNLSGRYDPGYEAWGMENVELSVKSWSCGSGVVMHPCSRVGRYSRLNRDETDGRYKDDSFMRANAVRFAEVWMDDYKGAFYRARGINPSEISKVAGDEGLTARKELKKQLKCEPFSWFVADVVSRIQEDYKVSPITYNPATLALSSSAFLPRTTETTPQQAVDKKGSQVPPPYDVTYVQPFRFEFNYVRGKNGPNCPTHGWGSVLLETPFDPEDYPSPHYLTFTRKNGIELYLQLNLHTLNKTYNQDDDRRIYIDPDYDDIHRDDYPQVYLKDGKVAGINWSVKDASRRHVTFSVERVHFDGRIPNPYTNADPSGDWKISHCVATLEFTTL